MRISEIVLLKKDSIKDDLITINDGKTKNAQRIIPIHENIKELIEYYKKNNTGEFLIFDGQTSPIQKRVNRRLSQIIPNRNKTFHSFRKNFSQQIEQTSIDDKFKKYLMGHSLNKDITHSVYNRGKINIDTLREGINNIEFIIDKISIKNEENNINNMVTF